MPYLIWLVLLAIIVFSYFVEPHFPKWIPLVVYLTIVITRAIQKIGDYIDWNAKHERDEKLKLEETIADLANRNIVTGGTRIKEEKKIKEDFLYERRKKRRQFFVKLIDSLFLK